MQSQNRQSRRRTRVSRPTKTVAPKSLITLHPIPPPRTVRPEEIHALHISTAKNEAQIVLLKAQLAKLRQAVIKCTDTIEAPERMTFARGHATSKKNLQESVDNARLVSSTLDEDIERAQMDDRVAQYREMCEQVKAAYLEVERLRTNALAESLREADQADAELLEATRFTSRIVTDIDASRLAKLEDENASMLAKLAAYELKIRKQEADADIIKNRKDKINFKWTLRNAAQRALDLDKENEDLVAQLNDDARQHAQAVDFLTAVVAKQRREICEHLMGLTAEARQDEEVLET